jgi:hypothetical protein
MAPVVDSVILATMKRTRLTSKGQVCSSSRNMSSHIACHRRKVSKFSHHCALGRPAAHCCTFRKLHGTIAVLSALFFGDEGNK